MNQETENLLFLMQPNLDWNCSCITALTLGETVEFEVEVESSMNSSDVIILYYIMSESDGKRKQSALEVTPRLIVS